MVKFIAQWLDLRMHGKDKDMSSLDLRLFILRIPTTMSYDIGIVEK